MMGDDDQAAGYQEQGDKSVSAAPQQGLRTERRERLHQQGIGNQAEQGAGVRCRIEMVGVFGVMPAGAGVPMLDQRCGR